MDDSQYGDPRKIIEDTLNQRPTFTLDVLEPIIRAAEQPGAQLVDFWTVGDKPDSIGGTIRVELREDADSVGNVVAILVAAYRQLPLDLVVTVAPHNPSADVDFSSAKIKAYAWGPGQPSPEATDPVA